MAVACSTCGNQNPTGATVCQYCGGGLAVAQGSNRGGYGPPPRMPAPNPYAQGVGPYIQGGYAPVAAPKDPQTGLLLELLPGLFFQTIGIGNLWAGETALGVGLLLGYWAFLFVEFLLFFVVIGFCLLPFNLIIPIASAIYLQRKLQARQLAGPVAVQHPF